MAMEMSRARIGPFVDLAESSGQDKCTPDSVSDRPHPRLGCQKVVNLDKETADILLLVLFRRLLFLFTSPGVYAWEGGRFLSLCHARFTGVLLVGDAGGP